VVNVKTVVNMKKKNKKAESGSLLPAKTSSNLPSKVDSNLPAKNEPGIKFKSYPKITKTIEVGGKAAAARALGKAVLRKVPYVGAALMAADLGKSAYDAYQNSKSKKEPASPSTGEGIKKYMNAGSNPSGNTTTTKGPVKPGGKPGLNVDQKKSADAYYSKLAGNKPASSTAPAKRKVTRTAAATISAPKREMPSTMSKPSTPGIQKGPEKRKFSDTEVKTMTAMKKGTQANGTMSEGAQRKISSIRAKARAKEARVERKSQRVEKRAAVRAVKKSYKK